jgi:hypothetical protein
VRWNVRGELSSKNGIMVKMVITNLVVIERHEDVVVEIVLIQHELAASRSLLLLDHDVPRGERGREDGCVGQRERGLRGSGGRRRGE